MESIFLGIELVKDGQTALKVVIGELSELTTHVHVVRWEVVCGCRGVGVYVCGGVCGLDTGKQLFP